MADAREAGISISFQEQRKNGRGTSPGSRAGLANLTPYKPGQSGNTGGRPKDTPSIVHALMRLLTLSSEELKVFEPENQAEVIALQRIKDAGAALNPVAIKATEITLNSVDGPVEKHIAIEQVNHGVREQAIKDFACYSQVSTNIHIKYCTGP